VRVECAADAGAACQTVTKRMQADGVPAAVSAPGSGGGSAILRVLVGSWPALRSDGGVASIEHGPRASGVYVRFAAGGSELTLLDANGHAVRSARSGAGLIAAARSGEEAPVWVVTGTDTAGVKLAARDFREADLRDRFAVAALPGGPVAVPIADGARLAAAGGP
jgi:hypothetical protein